MYWSDNYSAATCVYDEARAHGSPVGLLTVRSTAQNTQSHLAVLYLGNASMATHPSNSQSTACLSQPRYFTAVMRKRLLES